MRRLPLPALLVGVGLAWSGLAGAQGTAPVTPAPATPAVAAPQPQPQAGTVTLGGLLGKPATLTAAEMRDLPAQDMQISYLVGTQSVTHTFRGTRLYDLLLAAAPALDPKVKNDSLGFVVLAEGEDGYRAAFSWAELDPAFGNRAVLLAYDQDGGPLPAADGALRLVVPGDGKGGRYVSRLVRLTVLRAAR